MAIIDDLSAALVKADAAGDAAGAKILADHIRSMNTAAPAADTTAQQKSTSLFDIGTPEQQQARQTAYDSKLKLRNDLANQRVSEFAGGALAKLPQIGNNIINGITYLPGKLFPFIKDANDQRNAEYQNADKNLQISDFGNSTPYTKGGGIATDLAATSGVGPALGVVAKGAGAAPSIVNALATNGMQAGNTPGALNMLTRMAGGATTGGASAALVDPNNVGAGAVIGGALPPVLAGAGKVAGYAGKALNAGADALRGGGVSDNVRVLASRAKELGIDIPADRLVDSKPMNALASSLNYVPFSGRAATETTMEGQLTRAATKTFGQDSDNMAQALRKAGDDLGGKFEDTLKNNGVTFSKKLLDNITDIRNTAQKELGSDGLKAIDGQIDELVNKGQSGIIDGQAAYNIKRALDRIGNRNAPEAYHALQLKGALMDALDDSLGAEGAKAFAKTREQYGNMLALQKLSKNGADGDISVARLANMQNINNKPLQEIADIAAQFVKPREGQHGAMQRALVGASGAALGGPVGLGIGAATGRATNAVLNSQAAKNFLLRDTTQATNMNPLLNSLSDYIEPVVYRSAPVLSSSR